MAVTSIPALQTVTSGGTGTTTPSLVAGANISISGSWPNQTVTSTFGTQAAQDGLTALGTNRGTALTLVGTLFTVTTVASGTGVLLPSALQPAVIYVWNLGANPLQVYGAGTDTINGTAATTGVTLNQGTNGSLMTLTCSVNGAWRAIGAYI